MGVISGGALNGDIVVNSNDGSVYLLDGLATRQSSPTTARAVITRLLTERTGRCC
jgi:hypothetical protein